MSTSTGQKVLSLQNKVRKLQRAIRKQVRPLQKRIRSLGTELTRLLQADLDARGLFLYEDANCPDNIWVGSDDSLERVREHGGVPHKVRGPMRKTDRGYQVRLDGRWLGIISPPKGW